VHLRLKQTEESNQGVRVVDSTESEICHGQISPLFIPAKTMELGVWGTNMKKSLRTFEVVANESREAIFEKVERWWSFMECSGKWWSQKWPAELFSFRQFQPGLKILEVGKRVHRTLLICGLTN
jgi:hypothetical protein